MNKEVIIACDFSSKEELEKFLSNFNQKLFLKIGMELYYKEGPTIVEYAKKLGHKVFLDLKLHDIPNTVHKALKNIAKLNVDFVTVHASGGSTMLKATSEALEGTNTKALAVTVLTSIDSTTLTNELNVSKSIEEQAVHLAKLAFDNNIYGVICSPNEVVEIKKHVDIACITPGIRLAGDAVGDQKRVATPHDAYNMGSDYIVVGRSITSSNNPSESYNTCVKQFGGNYEQ